MASRLQHEPSETEINCYTCMVFVLVAVDEKKARKLGVYLTVVSHLERRARKRLKLVFVVEHKKPQIQTE